MSSYVRPPVEFATFVDISGTPIPYGDRWGIEHDVPDGMYSECRHPERFEPVLVVARALIEHLFHTYDVERAESVTAGRTTITLTPRSGGGTALTLTMPLLGVPGAEVAAGWRFRGLWPECGCDACDDDVNYAIEHLENTVLTIAEGGMSEWRSGAMPGRWLTTDDAGNPVGDEVVPWQVHVRFEGRVEEDSGGWSSDDPEPVELPPEPHRWAAWPIRQALETHITS